MYEDLDLIPNIKEAAWGGCKPVILAVEGRGRRIRGSKCSSVTRGVQGQSRLCEAPS